MIHRRTDRKSVWMKAAYEKDLGGRESAYADDRDARVGAYEYDLDARV